jgi:hypothetical protein
MSSVNSNSRIFQSIVCRGVKDISAFVEKLIVHIWTISKIHSAVLKILAAFVAASTDIPERHYDYLFS